ncbi:MAG: hypothetical protein HZB13_19795 [Acidobacteria bacterium]|nr:hypothetical protein [Acidobacteriota bacterium]
MRRSLRSVTGQSAEEWLGGAWDNIAATRREIESPGPSAAGATFPTEWERQIGIEWSLHNVDQPPTPALSCWRSLWPHWRVLTGRLAEESPERHDEATSALAILVARWAGKVEPAVVTPALTGWAEAVRARRSDAVWALASVQGCIVVLERWVAATAWKPDAMRRLALVLGTQSRTVLETEFADKLPWNLGGWQSFADNWDWLCKLDAVPEEECATFLQEGWTREVRALLPHPPERMAAMFRAARRWAARGAAQAYKGFWSDLFGIPSQRLLNGLLEALEGGAELSRIGALIDLLSSSWTNSRYLPFLDQRPRILRALTGSFAGADSVRHVECCLDALVSLPDQHEDALLEFASILLAEAPRESAGAFNALCWKLCPGDRRVVRSLLRRGASPPRWDYPGDPGEGWKALTRFPSIRTYLGMQAARARTAGRVIRLLQRLGLAVRLGETAELRVGFRQWETLAATPPTGDDSLLAAWRELCGKSSPDSKDGTSNAQERLEGEKEWLRRKRAEGTLAAAGLKRLEYLENRALDEARRSAEQHRKARTALIKALDLLQFEALEAIADGAMGKHYAALGLTPGSHTGDPDWEHALKIYASSGTNRRLLRAMLAQAEAGRREWPLDHPRNAAFLWQLSEHGGDRDRWLGPFREVHDTGGAYLQAYAETDMLKALQMGTHFSTCLSPHGCNSWSAAANATEANKRVLYVTDARGRMAGRRLVGLTLPDGPDRRPRLTPFHCYHAAPEESASPWIRILLDLLCLKIAREIGAGPVSESIESDGTAPPVALIGKWYDDGACHCDWWVSAEYVDVDSLPAQSAAPLLERVRSHIIEDESLSRSPFHWKVAPDLRCILWLGCLALPLLEEAGHPRIPPEHSKWLARWSDDKALKAWAEAGLR